MVRRASRSVPLAAAVLVLFAALSSAALPTASAQRAPAQQALVEAESYVDDVLFVALTDAGLVDDWVEASGVSAAASLVEVDGDEAYAVRRQELLADLVLLGERHQRIVARSARADQLISGANALEALVRAVRRDVSTTGRRAAVSLTPEVAEAARITLDSITGTSRWIGLSLDPLGLAEHRLVTARDDLQREVDDLVGADQRPKLREESVTRLTAVHGDLQRVHALVDSASQQAIAGQLFHADQQAGVVASFADLHELRLLRPSSVGGLSVVTLDAYVRGAEVLDATCPVDWALLAGIGRVESRHGTIDDTLVQGSGRVTKAILGPLLDGGATEREATQAEADAEAAEEALLLAEAEAEAALAEAAAEAQARLFGVIEEDTDDPDEDDETADQERSGPPRYDPLLWGDDLPFDEDDLIDLDEAGTVEDDEEEPEFKGNGFAVIADSDDGRLDGNTRWDRAVGPMQFIPETWSYWATDGNGDGETDPQNLYDAAASAGQFLCHLSRTRGPSPHSFVLGYNSSSTYVRNVMAVADAFASSELPIVAD